MLSPVRAAIVRRRVQLPLRLGDGAELDACLFSFHGLADGREHVALGLGDRAVGEAPRTAAVPLVRLHSECLTGDILGSQRCDCGPQLREAVTRISVAGGYLLYLRQEGRGIGLYNKIDAYALQDAGLDTYEANRALGFEDDERTYTVAAQMLLGLGVTRLDLLTNNPDKARQLEDAGIGLNSCVPTGLHVSSRNGRYLAAKASGGHDLIGLAHPAVSTAPRMAREPSAAHLPVSAAAEESAAAGAGGDAAVPRRWFARYRRGEPRR